MSLLHVYRWVRQRKNYENRLIFGEVMDKSLEYCFFLTHSVVHSRSSSTNTQRNSISIGSTALQVCPTHTDTETMLLRLQQYVASMRCYRIIIGCDQHRFPLLSWGSFSVTDLSSCSKDKMGPPKTAGDRRQNRRRDHTRPHETTGVLNIKYFWTLS